MLTREQILSKSDLKVQKVHVPEWDDDVYVRSLTAAERDQFEEQNLIKDKDRKRAMITYDVRMTDARARLVYLGTCDENGNRLFQESDIEVLAKKSSGAISRLYNIIASLSGITDEDLEDLLKN